MRKKLLSLLIVSLLLCGIPVMASAHDTPNPDRKGSITVTVHLGGQAVPGGTLTLYRVGAVWEEDGNYSFVPAGDFTGWGDSFGDVEGSAAELAKSLAKYASAFSGQTEPIDTEGTVTFSDLELGLYLLVQNDAPKGYSKLSPFLVSIPYLEDGEYIYDLDSSAKAELEREPEPTTPPTNPPSPGGKLPQTGQLWWPVPVLIAAGLLLIVVGLLRRRGSRNEPE